MASATPHPVSGISELRENRISRTSDSRRADLFLHRPREKPRRGRLPPLSVSHGGKRGAGRGAPDAPVGDDAERVSASIGKPEVTRQMGARPKAREGFSLLDAEGSCPQGGGMDGSVCESGSGPEMPGCFPAGTVPACSEGLPVRLASGADFRAAPALWRAPPLRPAGWTGESPQGPVRDGERKLDPHQDESVKSRIRRGFEFGRGVPGRRRWTKRPPPGCWWRRGGRRCWRGRRSGRRHTAASPQRRRFRPGSPTTAR